MVTDKIWSLSPVFFSVSVFYFKVKNKLDLGLLGYNTHGFILTKPGSPS